MEIQMGDSGDGGDDDSLALIIGFPHAVMMVHSIVLRVKPHRSSKLLHAKLWDLPDFGSQLWSMVGPCKFLPWGWLPTSTFDLQPPWVSTGQC